MVEIKIGIGTICLTDEEATEMYYDYSFLLDAFLMALNPNEAEKLDMPFDRETTYKYAKEMYLKKSNGWDKEKINKIFSIHELCQ